MNVEKLNLIVVIFSDNSNISNGSTHLKWELEKKTRPINSKNVTDFGAIFLTSAHSLISQSAPATHHSSANQRQTRSNTALVHISDTQDQDLHQGNDV